ncbi:MAG: asparagine synthase-related protein [Pseudomonadales bacterium]
MRPLVNYLLVHTPDPELRSTLLDRWGKHSDFASVHKGPGNWIRGVAPLPSSSPVEHSAGSTWLGICEGGENVANLSGFTHCLADAPETVGRYDGDISAIELNEQCAIAMRSPGGLVPWYVYRGQSGVAVLSNRFAWLQRHLPIKFDTDAFAHALACDGISCIDRRTPLHGVEAVPVGHIVQVDTQLDEAKELPHVRFWHPEALTPSRWHRDDAAERGAQLRQILIERLTADLDPGGANLLGLSGGVDSSCLGALAIGQAQRRVNAFTFLPAEDHPAYSEVDGFVRSIAEVVRPQHHWRFPLSELDCLACPERAPAVGMPVPHPALSHLPGMAAECSISVYTGGEAADDLFAGPFVLGKDWIEGISLMQLIRSLRAPWYGVARRFVARQWFEAQTGTREMPLPADSEPYALFNADICEEYADWIQNQQQRLKQSHHPYRHLLHFFNFDGWLKQNWEVCSELGIRRSLPFWCRQTIELALSIHPRFHALPPKRLIRLGMRNDVPALNLERPDKGAWTESATVTWEGGEIPNRLSPYVRPELVGTVPTEMDFGNADLLSVLIASTRKIE